MRDTRFVGLNVQTATISIAATTGDHLRKRFIVRAISLVRRHSRGRDGNWTCALPKRKPTRMDCAYRLGCAGARRDLPRHASRSQDDLLGDPVEDILSV